MPNLGYFLVSNSLSKIDNLVKYFYTPRYHLLGRLSSKYEHRKSIQRGVLLSQVLPFLALLINLGHFGHLVPGYK